MRPWSADRPARFCTCARPFSRSRSTARSKSPPVSTRAFLQSIMPAPVASRSAFTCAAEMSLTPAPRGGGIDRDRLSHHGLVDGRLGDDLGLGRRLDLGDLGDDGRVRRHRVGLEHSRRGDLGRHLGRLHLRLVGLDGLRGHLLHQIVLRHAAALAERVGDDASDERDRADRVVVARDDVVDLVGVAVRVDDRDHGDAQLARLGDRDVLLLRVDDEHGVGHPLEVLDADRLRSSFSRSRRRRIASFFGR